ncbi:hypothetical protein CLU79DRAFT_360716 [Phycomyces nitens]|nr:hypothetical protein CLU79DRAFT_360716 [Phycomyces nitens]
MTFCKLVLACVVLSVIIQQCYAPPISIQQPIVDQASNQINRTKTYKILKTIVLGYLTHIMTIRPSPDTDQKNTLFWRATIFVYPTMGIGTAITAIMSVPKADKILGIDHFKTFYAKKEKEALEKQGKIGKSWISLTLIDIWDSIKRTFCQLLDTLGFITYIPDKEPELDPADFKKNVEALKDEIVAYGEDGEYSIPYGADNVAYLAAILLVLKPRQAKRVKHCILNGSLYLGFDIKDDELGKYKEKLICTEDMTIVGSGSIHKYQAGVKAHSARYLTPEMLIQLQSVHYLDNTSYLGICITTGQLVYTVIECIDADGDRWAKVIMVIYMMMSVLQTISLWVLHKQIAACSIYYAEDIAYDGSDSGEIINNGNTTPGTDDSEPINAISKPTIDAENTEPINARPKTTHEDNETDKLIENDTSDDGVINPKTKNEADHTKSGEKTNDLLYTKSFLEMIVNQEPIYKNEGFTTFGEQKYWSYIISGLGGLSVSLMFGIWANYQAHTTTQWIVLAWILSPILMIGLIIIQKILLKEDSFLHGPLVCLTYLIGITGAACVLAGTVEGYTVKN